MVLQYIFREMPASWHLFQLKKSTISFSRPMFTKFLLVKKELSATYSPNCGKCNHKESFVRMILDHFSLDVKKVAKMEY